MLLKAKWFADPSRIDLTKIIDKNIKRQISQQTNTLTYEQEDKAVLYNMALSSAQMVIYHYLRYLLVDNKGVKPWLAKESVDKPLSKQEFIEYNAKTLQWLQGHAPNPYYAGLAHKAAVVNLLVKMEIE